MATFCLIHGKWHESSGWAPVAERLRAAGHDVATPDLPYDDPHTTFAERVQPAVASIAGAEGPVVVVAHSLATGYAPLVVNEVPGASIVYLCPAPIGPFSGAGAPMRASRPGFPFPPDGPDGTSAWDPETAIAVMYPRLAPELARSLSERLKPGSSPSDSYPLNGQPDAPITFIYGRHDEFFEPDWSRWVAANVAHVEPVELDTGHFAMLEAPDAVAGRLLAVP